MTNHNMDCTPVPELTSGSECPLLDHAPVLTVALLTRMQRLNLEYLQLLLEIGHTGAQLSGPCAHAESLPASTLQNLRQLSPSALQSMAATPYALYTLGFEDQEFWLATLGAAANGSSMHGSGVHDSSLRVAEEATSASEFGCRLPRHAAFGEVVIFFAWHMSVANPWAARVMCGMPAAVSACLQTASFGKLQSVMRTCPWVLMPRWSSHLRFWPDLVRLAAGGDVPALRQTQLLGNQLMACDLRLAESPPPELAARQRAARSAQAQRWKLHSHR